MSSTDQQGLPAHVVVTEYLGEMYPPFRWCEKMAVVEQAQKKFGQSGPPPAPSLHD